MFDAQKPLYHRSLNIWKSICSLWEDIFVQVWASFQSVLVTRPVVTDGTARYRMKSMGITFPLILTHTPLSFLWVKLFGYYSHSKSSIFSKSWKFWNLTNSAQRRSTNFWRLFIKLLLFLDKSRFWHLMFMGEKKLVNFQTTCDIFKFESGLIL